MRWQSAAPDMPAKRLPLNPQRDNTGGIIEVGAENLAVLDPAALGRVGTHTATPGLRGQL